MRLWKWHPFKFLGLCSTHLFLLLWMALNQAAELQKVPHCKQAHSAQTLSSWSILSLHKQKLGFFEQYKIHSNFEQFLYTDTSWHYTTVAAENVPRCTSMIATTQTKVEQETRKRHSFGRHRPNSSQEHGLQPERSELVVFVLVWAIQSLFTNDNSFSHFLMLALQEATYPALQLFVA